MPFNYQQSGVAAKARVIVLTQLLSPWNPTVEFLCRVSLSLCFNDLAVY